MNSFELGYAAGLAGAGHNTNPYTVESNDYLCWDNGLEHGSYKAAKDRASITDIEEIQCTECYSEGERIFLPDGDEIWDPSGDIHPSGAPDEVHSVPEGYESLICEGCSGLFAHRKRDAFWNYPPHLPEDYESGSVVDPELASYLAKTPTSPTEHAIGFVYIVRSAGRIRIGKASSPNRYKSYQRALPHGCEVLRIWKLAKPLSWESHLHSKFRRFRIHGSWYEIPDADLQDLLKLEPPNSNPES